MLKLSNKGLYRLGFQNMVVGRILTGFSYDMDEPDMYSAVEMSIDVFGSRDSYFF